MLKQAIVIRTDLEMGKGKIASQASHASVEGYIESAVADPNKAEEWWRQGQKKIVLKVKSEKELREIYLEAKKRKIIAVMIRDAGHTQIEKGSVTAIALGPEDEKELDHITGKLKLL